MTMSSDGANADLTACVLWGPVVSGLTVGEPRPILVSRSGVLWTGYHWTVEAWWQAERIAGRWWDHRAPDYEPHNATDRFAERLVSFCRRRRYEAERRHPRAHLSAVPVRDGAV